MQISNNISNFWMQQLQQNLTSTSSSAEIGLQQLPAAGQSSTSSSQASSSTTAASGITASSNLLGSDSLNWLINSQQTAATNLANDIISAVNPGGTSIDLAQVSSATGQSSSSLASGFAALDPNSSGQVTASQLASDLTSAFATAMSGWQDANSTSGATGLPSMGGVGHHHHHHHGGTSQNSSSTSSASSTTSTGTAGSSTADTTVASGGTATSTDTTAAATTTTPTTTTGG
jgi:hypothetical protein